MPEASSDPRRPPSTCRRQRPLLRCGLLLGIAASAHATFAFAAPPNARGGDGRPSTAPPAPDPPGAIANPDRPSASPSGPQPPGPDQPDGSRGQDPDAWVRLFREGRALAAEGRSVDACRKFDLSLGLRRSPGTLLNVGNCRQDSGRLTAARAAFAEALELAQREPDVHKSEAWSRAARRALELIDERIPHLVVSAPRDAGARVTLDGVQLRDFERALPIDPGQHRLAVLSDGQIRFEQALELSEGRTRFVELPALTPPAREASSAPPPIAAEPARSASRAAAERGPDHDSHLVPWLLVATGGAGLVAGGIAGAIAARRASTLADRCPNHVCEQPRDLATRDAAYDIALTADILLASGFVAAALGTTWLLFDEDPPAPNLTAACDGKACAAALRGTF